MGRQGEGKYKEKSRVPWKLENDGGTATNKKQFVGEGREGKVDNIIIFFDVNSA